MTTKNAYVPKSFSTASELAKFHEEGRDGDMGQPVKVLTMESVKSSIAKQPELQTQTVTLKDKKGHAPVSIAALLLGLAEISEARGYFTTGDVKEVGRLSGFDRKSGTGDFQKIMLRLIQRGYLANGAGAPAKNMESTIDVSLCDF